MEERRPIDVLQCEFPYCIEYDGGIVLIKEYLRSGGFGHTYRGTFHFITGNAGKMDDGQDVVIKEFFMNDFCRRKADGVSVDVVKYPELVRYNFQKFVKEIAVLKRLKHANIVNIRHWFEANNTLYYVMDYVEGHTVFDYIRINKSMTFSKAWECLRPICVALRDEVHQQGIYHSDISPTNIILMKNEKGQLVPVLIDFGLARIWENGEEGGVPISNTKVTTTSDGYSAFELHCPRDPETQKLQKIDARTDIYSIGAILYYMVSGKHPTKLVESLSVDDKTLQKVLDRTVRKKKEDRFSSMQEMIVFCDNLLQEAEEYIDNIPGNTELKLSSDEKKKISGPSNTKPVKTDGRFGKDAGRPATGTGPFQTNTTKDTEIPSTKGATGNSGNGGTGGAGTPPPVKEKSWLEKYGLRLLIAVVLAALLALVPEVLNNQQEPPVVDPIPPVVVPEDPNKQLKEDLDKLFTEVRNGEIGENTVLDLFEEDAYFVVIAGDQEIGGPADLSHQIEHLLLPTCHYKVGQDYRVKEIYRNDQTGKFTSIEIEKIK